jgi:2-amino-4-hydroxy-6-hydroxymethyldihydropteridine diphosphokinase
LALCLSLHFSPRCGSTLVVVLNLLSVFICVHLWFHFSGMVERKLIYLSLGSNLGDRAANLERAIEELPAAGVKVLRRSATYETEPVDLLEQPWFLNCVVEAETTLTPRDLLDALQGIERKLGSRKLVPSGPRIIDLDVLFYGSDVIHEAGIEIPHPRLTQRRFVLIPLAELAPDLRHPVFGKTAAELLAATPDRSAIRIWQPGKGNANSPAE